MNNNEVKSIFEVITTNEPFIIHISIGDIFYEDGEIDKARLYGFICDQNIDVKSVSYQIESDMPLNDENKMQMIEELENQLEDEDVFVCQKCLDILKLEVGKNINE